MSYKISKKLESKIDAKLRENQHRNYKPFDGFDSNKVMGEVLDKSTTYAIYKMINAHIISYVNGVVNAGKESVVFWAKDESGKDIALKIYLISTLNFKRRLPYIVGDPRFGKMKKGTRNMVYLWAKKEFRNLVQCFDSGIPIPKPIHVSQNVLVMSFIGDKDGKIAKTLRQTAVDINDYNSIISIISKMYKDAKLVHGDLSEYNIFKRPSHSDSNNLIVFDLGSAVDIRHPNSTTFLKRDINNITKFFVKRGLTVPNPSDVYKVITTK
jgi:RIO kinase 1